MLALRLLFFIAGGALASFYPFLSALLAGRGFSPVEIGAATALTSLAYTIAAPTWGHLGDVVLGRARALRIAAVGATVLFLGLLIPDVGQPLTVAILVGFFAFEAALGPLSDALAVNALGDRQRDYPRIRVLGSASFAIAVIVFGFVYDRTGFGLVPIIFGISMLGVALTAGRVPDVERLRMPVRQGRGGVRGRMGGASFRLALAVQPRLVPLMIGFGLIHVGILAAFTYLSLRILDLGGAPSHIALGSGMAATAEIPAMAAIGLVVARIGLRWLVVGGALVYGAALVAWALLDSLPAIIAVRGVTGVAFAAIAIGAVMAIGRLLPRGLQATGQGMFATVAFGIAAVIASSLGGIVYSVGGHVPLFVGAAGAVALGVAVIWRALPARHEEIDVPELPGGADVAGVEGEAAVADTAAAVPGVAPA